MINLIPPSARKGVVIEYWVRVAAVWMFLLGAACILLAVFYSPSYLLIQLQLKAFSENYQEASVKAENFEEGGASIREANRLSSLLLETTGGTSFLEVTERLTGIAGSGVTVLGLRIERDETGISLIKVEGLASTRFALNEYRNRIEAEEMFSDVYLPLSNLAKEENINFLIEVSMATPNTP